MADVLEIRQYSEWWGLGFVAQSVLTLSRVYAKFDSDLRFEAPAGRVADPKARQGAEVLELWQRQVLGIACAQEQPLGTLIVSSVGARAEYFDPGRAEGDSFGANA